MIEASMLVVGIGLVVWGAEQFAENLAAASARLGVSAFALAILLAGAEPEELATAVAAGVRDVPAVAFGDVVGANTAICLVALPVAALIGPLPFSRRVLRYAVLGLPVGALAVGFAWDGSVGRVEGLVLVASYASYVAWIWIRERQPPSLGETAELDEDPDTQSRVGRALFLVLAGTAAIVTGASLLVEAVRRFTDVETSQTKLSLTIVGFATAFELVVLAWSTARRGMSEAVVAAVIGSYAYNATMTLGAAAVITPLEITDTTVLRPPMLVMLAALAVVVVLARLGGRLTRREGVGLLVGYGVFLAVAVAS
ncbi:MAG: sodium:calcium antiporter [Acidimicrobiales bacterium]